MRRMILEASRIILERFAGRLPGRPRPRRQRVQGDRAGSRGFDALARGARRRGRRAPSRPPTATSPASPSRTWTPLIVDEMGKNVSGAGMDTNVIGTKPGLERPRIGAIYVRSLTPETHGNATGIGQADVIAAAPPGGDRLPLDLHEHVHRQAARRVEDAAHGRERPPGDAGLPHRAGGGRPGDRPRGADPQYEPPRRVRRIPGASRRGGGAAVARGRGRGEGPCASTSTATLPEPGAPSAGLRDRSPTGRAGNGPLRATAKHGGLALGSSSVSTMAGSWSPWRSSPSPSGPTAAPPSRSSSPPSSTRRAGRGGSPPASSRSASWPPSPCPPHRLAHRSARAGLRDAHRGVDGGGRADPRHRRRGALASVPDPRRSRRRRQHQPRLHRPRGLSAQLVLAPARARHGDRGLGGRLRRPPPVSVDAVDRGSLRLAGNRAGSSPSSSS